MKKCTIILLGAVLFLTSCEKTELVEPQPTEPKEWTGGEPYHGLPPGYWEKNPQVENSFGN